MVQTAASILLDLQNFREVKPDKEYDQTGPELLFEYPLINSLGLQPPNPALLLQKNSNVLPFPPYFQDLYSVLNEMKDIDNHIIYETSQLRSIREKIQVSKILARKKVEVLERYLIENSGSITPEGFELLLPYIRDLFQDPKTTVQAAWSILRLVGKELAPAELSKNLMPYLTQLFSGENTTPKHMKLYHRSFLVPLCLTIGLESFLTNFSTLLVEAVAGYKNFDVSGDASLTNIDQADEEEEGFFPSNSGFHGNSSFHGNEDVDNVDSMAGPLQPIAEGK